MLTFHRTPFKTHRLLGVAERVGLSIWLGILDSGNWMSQKRSCVKLCTMNRRRRTLQIEQCSSLILLADVQLHGIINLNGVQGRLLSQDTASTSSILRCSRHFSQLIAENRCPPQCSRIGASGGENSTVLLEIYFERFVPDWHLSQCGDALLMRSV